MGNHRRARTVGWGLAAALFAAGGACGSSGGGMGASGYTTDLGAAEASKVVRDVQDTFRRLGYEIEVNNGPPAILIQTRWRPGLPTEGEKAAGATETRTRLRVTARQRAVTDAAEVFVSSLRIEHQVRLGPDTPWQEIAADGEFLEWARTVARDLELQLQSGRGR